MHLQFNFFSSKEIRRIFDLNAWKSPNHRIISESSENVIHDVTLQEIMEDGPQPFPELSEEAERDDDDYNEPVWTPNFTNVRFLSISNLLTQFRLPKFHHRLL